MGAAVQWRGRWRWPALLALLCAALLWQTGGRRFRRARSTSILRQHTRTTAQHQRGHSAHHPAPLLAATRLVLLPMQDAQMPDLRGTFRLQPRESR